MDRLADGMIYYVVFLLSTTLHEAAHAWVAKRGGDPTAYHGGQVTLDPRPHIRREPFGMVILPLLGVVMAGWPFGFASAPYDPRWAQQYPRRAAVMALGGPAANLLLVLFAGLLLRVGFVAGLIQAPDRIGFGHVAATSADGLGPAVAFFLGAVFSLNLLLAVFNLLPFPPLDGSGVPPLILRPDQARRYQQFIWGTPAIGLIGIMAAWYIFDDVFSPIFFAAVSVLYPGVTYGR